MGLAGALLADLVDTGEVTIQQGRVASRRRKDAPLDPLVARLAAPLRGETTAHPVRDWLRFLAEGADRQVADHLQRLGWITPVPSRLGLRPARVHLVRGEHHRADVQLARISARLPDRDRLPTEDVVIAGLLRATGLASSIVADLDRAAATEHLDRLLDALDPPRRACVAATAAAVGEATLRHP